MSKLPVVSGAECVKALGKVGFVVYRQRGSHITMVRKSPPSQTTIPNHKELDRGTLRAIIRQTGLTVEGFLALTQLPADLTDKIDKVATDALARTGVPSASVAIVKDGQVVYVKAYGDARLEPKTPATAEMRYSIGSISKQFTAAAILLLQEQGKLSLDDKVGKFMPDLTRANDVTIRQLLSHTSGYQDYWPQDYVMPMMLDTVSAARIMTLWAKK